MTSKKNIIEEYKAFINIADETLSKESEWTKLIEVYNHSQNIGLHENLDTFRLAELYAHTGNSHTAKELALELQSNIQWTQAVDTLLRKYDLIDESEPTPSTNTTVPLTKIANQFIITVKLSNTPTKLLIDTGASMTTINQSFYETIKSSSSLTYKSTQSFLTANGKVSGDIYTLKTLSIGEYVISNIDIAVLDYSSPHSSGLLGMNVLQQFKFHIDQQNNWLELEPAQPED